MFSKLKFKFPFQVKFKGIHSELFSRIIFINIVSVLLSVFFMIVILFVEYKSQERAIAKEKLLKYWILENNRLSDRQTNVLMERAYLQDIVSSNIEYGLRLVDKDRDAILYLFPDTWFRYDMYNLIFPKNYNITGNEIRLNRKSFADGEEKPSVMVMYSIKTGDRIIQILILTEARRSFVRHMTNNGARVILVIGLLGSIAALIIVSSVMKPIYKINALAEQIIEKQQITQRVPKSKFKNEKGEFAKLEDNINKMLDTIERLVKRLQHANVSLGHDIRTPLTHIKNNCESLLLKTKNKDSLEKLQACMLAVTNIQRLAKNMLSLSEIESGLVKIPKKLVNIEEALDGIIEMYTYVADERKIQFEVSIEKNIKAQIDATWLRQLVGNLLDNAMKFTPSKKRVVLNISTLDNKVCITVADEGKGISDEDISHIWDTGWKKGKTLYNNKVKEEIENSSSGFGLSIVKSIITAYRGSVVVSSTLGQGTIFTVKFKNKKA